MTKKKPFVRQMTDNFKVIKREFRCHFSSSSTLYCVCVSVHDTRMWCLYLPMVISLQLPKKKYTKLPMKPEYRPYCGGRPATTAYAIPCGIAVKPTVKPATKSWNK